MYRVMVPCHPGACCSLKKRLLLGLLLWVLLLLAASSYFMDAGINQLLLTNTLARADSRRLASAQGNGKKAQVNATDGVGAADSKNAARLKEPRREPLTDVEPQNVLQKTLKVQAKKSRHSGESEDGVLSDARQLVRNLWRGKASPHMLSWRLQLAKEKYMNQNKHRASYRGHRKADLSRQELLCQLKKLAVLRTLDGTEQPFSGMGWKSLVPSRPLSPLSGAPFRTCAAVASAGAILTSELGQEIDSHDAVVRFNAAPTNGYENDVGKKTTHRVINSQILGRPNFNFMRDDLYKNITLVAWDPAPYTLDLNRWYQSPDFDLFRPYAAHRKMAPEQPFYILHPQFIWSLWDMVQANTHENIQPNPPSTGFIGIALMMTLCDEVHAYEYIPSQRLTDLCHYYEEYRDDACTLGAYHPLLFEKMLVQRMSSASEDDVKIKGKVVLPGFHTLNCPPT